MTAKNDNNPIPPRGHDRMPGRHWRFWWLPPGRTSRWRRHVDGRILRRYAGTVVKDEAAAVDADNDPSDCRHGCNGDCVANGNPDGRCNFTCHPHLMACPRCDRVMERQEFHDHEYRDCGFMWSCRRCGFMESGVFVGCEGD